MNRILLFGDSNTYGYEPSEIMPGRYPAEVRWADRLADALGEDWEILPRGLNGRTIPDVRTGIGEETVCRMLEEAGPEGIFEVMLGTNDLLLTGEPNADRPIRKMERFLSYVTKRKTPGLILLVAPPYIGYPDSGGWPFLRQCYEESKAMNGGFKMLAAAYGVSFADAGEWGIQLSYDQVHIAPEGHRRFAECIEGVIRDRFCRK